MCICMRYHPCCYENAVTKDMMYVLIVRRNVRAVSLRRSTETEVKTGGGSRQDEKRVRRSPTAVEGSLSPIRV